MPDVFTPAKRSAVMSRIRSSGNRDTELRMIALFRTFGITGWRRQQNVFGKPDFIFPKQQVALFIDGCFWHRHGGCKFSYTPKSRLDFWLRKFSQNVARDRLVTRTLRRTGWRVMRIWECDLGPRRQHRVINRVRRVLEFVPIRAKQSSKKLKIVR
jgi:DNA mismatch endonuclease (patch repair protein)